MARTKRDNLRRRARWLTFLGRLNRYKAPALLFFGWAAVAAGMAELTAAPAVVWPVAAGLLAWGLFGYRRLWTTLWLGLDTLRRVKRENRDDY